MANVYIEGCGTIGGELTRLLARHKNELGISQVVVSKKTPRLEDVPAVSAILSEGALFAASREDTPTFTAQGLEVAFSKDEARRNANIIIDCTPKGIGIKNQNLYYKDLVTKDCKAVIAQGSETGFGEPYAFGVNDDMLKTMLGSEKPFIQIVSCNSHAIAVICQLIGGNGLSNLEAGYFLCIRRATDINQRDEGRLSPTVTKPKGRLFGTHHAGDVIRLFETINLKPAIISQAVIVPTQYMHVVNFIARLKKPMGREELEKRFQRDERTAVTQKSDTATVFAHIRDYSQVPGRMINFGVLSIPSLWDSENHGGSPLIAGDVFVAQDSNSLISSIAAVACAINPRGYKKRVMDIAKQYLFKEV